MLDSGELFFCFEGGSLNFVHHWGNLSDDPLLEFQRLVRCMVVGRETTHQFIPLGLPTLIVRCHVPGKVISGTNDVISVPLHGIQSFIRAPVIHQRRLC